MKIVYYTSGVTGWGRVVIGISIYNALRRMNAPCEFTIISSSGAEHLNGGFRHIRVPMERTDEFSEKRCRSSALYRTIMDIKPDVLLVDLMWHSLLYFIEDLPCKKIFLYHQTAERYFSIEEPGLSLAFRPEQYDSIIAIEPIKPPFKAININPIVHRNRDEILPPDDARRKLNIAGNRQACLFSFNPKLGDYEGLRKKYSYLSDVYQVINTNDHPNGLFPQVDYFNAFDFIVCSGGYNQFWEAVYFEKEAVYEPIPLIFENQEQRINLCSDFKFTINGADQLAEIIMNM